MIPPLLCCRGLAGIYDSFALGRLESEAPSTFAQLGFKMLEFLYFDPLCFQQAGMLLHIPGRNTTMAFYLFGNIDFIGSAQFLKIMTVTSGRNFFEGRRRSDPERLSLSVIKNFR
jgi:hypothetical protein